MDFPEKSSAGTDNQGAPDVACARNPDFGAELRALYAAAGGSRVHTYRKLASLKDTRPNRPAGARTFKISKSSLGEWLGKGKRSVPSEPEQVRFVLHALIRFLEDQASLRSPGHRQTDIRIWKARLDAARAVSRSSQGGRGGKIDDSSKGRLLGLPSQALQSALPTAFTGREEELDALSAFVTAPDSGPSYVWWQADAWAGKSALLAWFATRRLPAGIDAAHYFIARRLGTNSRQDFLRAVGDQLATAAAPSPRASPHSDPDQLHTLFEAAARTSAVRRRRLVLIVDGLDEDGDAALGRQSIAALLPRQPPHGMRIIVSGRAHPPLPSDLDGHPLRDPHVVRRLAPSPAAHVVRDTALHELASLLHDRTVGAPLVGVLAVAEGSLTAADLAAVTGARHFEVLSMLRTVASRSLAPTMIDRALLTAPDGEDSSAGLQPLVLAHEELRAAASHALGKDELRTYTRDLHSWADRYWESGWPTDTPSYLLTGYTRLVQRSKDTGRLEALVLDPRRQLRLIQRSGPDIALADLTLISSPEDPPPANSLAVAAQTAVSREALRAHTEPLPPAIAQTVARLGDAQRAKSLATTSPQPAAKAAGLAQVARVLADLGHRDAGKTAQEAAHCARTSLSAAQRFEHAETAEAAACQAALALLATGQHQDGLALLRSTRRPSSTRYEAWAEAAALLQPQHPQLVRLLLDDLEAEADGLAAESGHAPSTAIAVQIWETVTATAPQRARRLHARALRLAQELQDTPPAPGTAGTLAALASLVATARPADATRIATTARRHLQNLLLQGTAPSPAADHIHWATTVRHTLVQVIQALTHTGTPDNEVRALRAEAEHALRTATPDLEAHPDQEKPPFETAEELANEAFRLANRDNPTGATQHLDLALAQLPVPDLSGSPFWLPDLAAALVQTDATITATSLPVRCHHPAVRARTHAAIAIALADMGQAAQARRHACQAAEHLPGPSSPADTPRDDTTWAHIAHAHACTGQTQEALDAFSAIHKPADRSSTAAWRTTDRLARIALAAALLPHAPQTAADLLHPLLRALDASRRTPQGRLATLARLAELLPARAPDKTVSQDPLGAMEEAARDYRTTHSPESWLPETVLVHALLDIGQGHEPGTQLRWLHRDMANRGPAHSPTAALAVVHAALGDLDTALSIATRHHHAPHRALALTAVAEFLARTPTRPTPAPDPLRPAPFTRTIQHLARTVTPLPADNPAAARFLHHSLRTASWNHTLPALAHLEPDVIPRLHHIAAIHTASDTRPTSSPP
ncbi:hypothetical protein ACFYVL_31605 [Streptomyces sp. NPDC004111]|uniref:hypothetical protein n=1 Tax=Streptomyces sp. NPDC004111 TaxID=3364690 RepID=UPI0036C7054A